MGRLDGQTAIVTGAAQGLGRAFADALTGEGAQVVGCDVSTDIDKAATAGGWEGRVVDVSDVDAVASLIDDVDAHRDGIDVLINNAAVIAPSSVRQPLAEAVAELDRQWATNVRGVFTCGRAVLPRMIERGRGHIVNLSTDHVIGPPNRGIIGMSPLDVYDACKWALHGFTLDWAAAGADHGVRVNAFGMGATDTPMLRNWLGDRVTPDQVASWLRPEQVAGVLVDLLTEGPDGRTGAFVGVWPGEPVVLPPPEDTSVYQPRLVERWAD
ncbi:MAG: SDR family oxidoreductase [Actinomycetota bacterium]